MIPTELRESWALPKIATERELAAWLQLSIANLQWLADRRGIEATTRHEKLRNYHYRPLIKRFGRVRLIESPKPRLKAVQRHVLKEILDRVPPHNAAHGFRRGRSVLSFAKPHQGQRVVLRMDLEDFFPTIQRAKVHAVFRAIGYRAEVASYLAALTTNSTPSRVWAGLKDVNRQKQCQTNAYRWPHLPQGAPTSPTIANLAAYRLDARLTGLARSAGATYTRYADDLAFSGDDSLRRSSQRFLAHAAAAAMDEGFTVNFRKTRVMKRGTQQKLAGVVVNQHPNVCRKEYDRLKSTLHNCVCHGTASQNQTQHRDWKAHLAGKVAWVNMINPARGAKLQRLLEQIEWNTD